MGVPARIECAVLVTRTAGVLVDGRCRRPGVELVAPPSPFCEPDEVPVATCVSDAPSLACSVYVPVALPFCVIVELPNW